jgi:hypothetical protein
MTATRFGSLGAVLLAMMCACVLAVTSMLTSAFVFGVEKVIAQIKLLADEGFILSGTGEATPDPTYIDQVESLYLQPMPPLFPGQPTFDNYSFQGLTTPEDFCPFVCIPGQPDLNFGQSLALGTADLNTAIVPALQDGNNVAVFGFSQSATVATQEMDNLIANTPAGVDLSKLHVVLIGDPNTPTGGILDRFQFPDGVQAFSLSPAEQHVPFVNIPLGIPPTPTTAIPTDIYTGEYDGYADFPQDQDPLNGILADINALIGIDTVHPFYPDLTPEQLAAAIPIGTIGQSNYYDIPENLPILAFMFDGGPAGQFFGDAFSPFLRLFIDWTYGNAGDPAVDGFHPIPLGGGDDMGGPDGSPYEAAVGVAGGPWADTPYGTLYDGSLLTSAASSGIAGFFDKMDPLQMLAGVENAAIQTLVGPFADILADINGGTLSSGDITTVTDVTTFLQTVTGYDLINLVDQGVLDLLKAVPDGQDVVDGLLDGPLIPGQPLIDLLGGAFDVFNFFGA